MSIGNRLKNKETVAVTPRQDIRPSTAFPDTYRKGERYLAELQRTGVSKVYIPNGNFEYWTFFIEDMDGFFIDIEQQREDRLKEIGIS
jgi:hypothetical protein